MFKIGDKVRATRKGMDITAGKVYEVVGYFDGRECDPFVIDDVGDANNVGGEDGGFVKVEPFKVGDKVRFVNDNRDGGPSYGMKGDTGTINAVLADERVVVNVDVKRSILDRPAAYVDDLELVTETETRFKPGQRIRDVRWFGCEYYAVEKCIADQVWILSSGESVPYYIDFGTWEVEPEPEVTGPVKQVTKNMFVPGVYGRIKLASDGHHAINVTTTEHGRTWSAEELRAAAATLNTIAEAMENV